jgi:hypothetical protein
LEAAVGAVLVTRIAVNGGVSAGQREAIVVILDVFIGDLPSAYSVALLAICAQLATMDVSMAILAALAYVGEHHFYMALRAGDCRMHATKRVAGLIVIEFRNGTNRFPGACCVTVLTRHGQISVRTVRPPRGLCSGTFHENKKCKN